MTASALLYTSAVDPKQPHILVMTPIDSWKRLYDLELRVRAQDMVIEKGFTTSLLITKHGVGNEVPVHSDLPRNIARNSYYTKRVLYHLRRILEVSTELAPSKIIPGEVQSFADGPLPFELDAFLSAASTIVIEQPYRARIEKYLPRRLKREFSEIVLFMSTTRSIRLTTACLMSFPLDFL